MTRHLRSRRIAHFAIPLLAATALALGTAGCSSVTPNTTLTPHSEFGRSIDDLFRLTLILGTIVFIGVETALIITIVKWRRRPNSPAPRQTHGNTTLEITWTLIPAVVLAIIAVPTIRTIFRTQAAAAPGSIKVQVIGHQWWWEFRYPDLNVVTANELYLPVGKTINFELRTNDVLHSFWIPELAGKRDLISNHTNYLWFTPESTYAWNGFCAEYCGASHGNMHFRVFTVTPAEFDTWVKHQQSGPAFATATTPTPSPGAPTGGPPANSGAAQGAQTPNNPTAPTAGPVTAQPQVPTATGTYQLAQLPAHIKPDTPIPNGLTFPDNLTGDATRGATLYKTSVCIGCHTVQGVSPGIIGPNLTHVGSRTTIAGALFPNDAYHLARWIKNAPLMKAGVLMPTLGKGQRDPSGAPVTIGYDDQQIADLVAYLQSLK